MHSNQRRRTGRVDGNAGTFQTQIIGQPTAQKTSGRTGGDVRVQVEKRIAGFVLVIVVHPANEDARAITDLFGHPGGSFQSFPTDFHQQSLLRVHPRGFAWRDAEEFRIHLIDVVQKRSVPRIHAARNFRIVVMERGLVPAIVGCF